MLYFHKVCITEVKLLREWKQQNNTTMSSEERIEKFKEQLSKIRQKGAELEAALQTQKERKEFAKMVAEERDRQDAKKRTFANAQNAEEAEGTLPTLEQLANGGTPLRSNSRKWKTREEILEDGTLIEKLRLYFSSGDLDGYFGTKGKLTKAEIAKIVASIRTREDKVLVEKCYREYSALRKYGEQLRFYFKRFQTSFAMLAVSLNKWDGYERTAKLLSDLFSSNPETAEASLYEVSKKIAFDGATLKVDKEKLSFVVDIFGRGGLYSQIKQHAKSAKDDLRDFKAFTDVLGEFMNTSTLLYMPISIVMNIENAAKESYARYLVKNTSFFRSELNERRENGEDITPEEERRAVIPDFYEVTPTKEVYKACKKYIKDLTKND